MIPLEDIPLSRTAGSEQCMCAALGVYVQQVMCLQLQGNLLSKGPCLNFWFANLVEVKWYFRVALFCISLIIKRN